jgi:hypothetical protein
MPQGERVRHLIVCAHAVVTEHRDTRERRLRERAPVVAYRPQA